MTNWKGIRLRFWPLSSFMGLLDLKTGVTVALLFALLNKVAGVYGLIAALTGAGGSFAQLSLYVYSAVALIAFAWALRAIKDEDPKQTLYFAHLYFADHIFSTSWTVYFALAWWVYKPHDGKQHVNSPAQEHLFDVYIGNHTIYTDEQRAQAAADIWNQEKSTAASVIILSWLTKIYFALLLYSYAIHLRQGSYRLLPHSRPLNDPQSTAADGWEDEAEDEIPLPNPFNGDTNNYRRPGDNVVFDEADSVEAARAHS